MTYKSSVPVDLSTARELTEEEINHPVMRKLDRHINGNPLGPQYAREQIADVIDEIKPLLEAHYREIAHFRDIPLKPDYPRYAQAEERGTLRIFTARMDSRLVGYAIYFVTPSLHYSDSVQAHQDILFVHSDFRRSTVGLRLIRHADEALAGEGVQIIYQHSKAAHSIGPVLERQGYELVDEIYAKRFY